MKQWERKISLWNMCDTWSQTGSKYKNKTKQKSICENKGLSQTIILIPILVFKKSEHGRVEH